MASMPARLTAFLPACEYGTRPPHKKTEKSRHLFQPKDDARNFIATPTRCLPSDSFSLFGFWRIGSIVSLSDASRNRSDPE